MRQIFRYGALGTAAVGGGIEIGKRLISDDKKIQKFVKEEEKKLVESNRKTTTTTPVPEPEPEPEFENRLGGCKSISIFIYLFASRSIIIILF